MRKSDKLKNIQEANKRLLNEILPPGHDDYDSEDDGRLNYNTVINNISKELTKEILDIIKAEEDMGRPQLISHKVEATIYHWLQNNSDSVTNLGHLSSKSGYNSKH